jgi:hypothetical protein
MQKGAVIAFGTEALRKVLANRLSYMFIALEGILCHQASAMAQKEVRLEVHAGIKGIVQQQRVECAFA